MDPKSRTAARTSVMQALYQWQLTQAPVNQLVIYADSYVGAEHEMDAEYFHQILEGVIDHIDEVDEQITIFSVRSGDSLDGVERAVLRLAVYELLYRIDIPYKVIINEACDICKSYGSVDGYKFVNGILDKVAKNRQQSISE